MTTKKKIAVWVLNIGNYRPEISKHTLPTIKAFADRIGAEYREITERKFQGWPITYEKMQVYELGKDYDWNILCDADVLISSKMPDLVKLAEKETDTIISYQQCNIVDYFKYHESFKSLPAVPKIDGSGSAIVAPSANFVITNKKTNIIYKPLGLTFEEMVSNVKIPSMVDEYNMAVQMAENGLKTKTLRHIGLPDRLLFHAALTSNGQTVDWEKEKERVESMPKKLVLVTSSESFSKISEVTHPSIKSYAEKIGADFCVIDKSEIKNPKDWKFHISDKLEEYDRVLYVDSDLIIRPDAPDIFDIVPEGEIGLLYESRFLPKTQELNQILDVLKFPQEKRLGKFYGTGVIVASKVHSHIFSQRDLVGKIPCEMAINVNLQMASPKIFGLPYKFNYQHFMDKFTGDVRHAAYFVNYSGALGKLGVDGLVDIIKKDLEIWEKDGPEFKYKKNIGIVIGGGIGDQIAAEPTARYIIEHLYKGENIVISCNWPELFSHLGVPVFTHGDPNIPAVNWFELYTLRSPEYPIWDHVSHTLTNATDYAAISALRMQLPLKHRSIKLPHSKVAKDRVSELVSDIKGKKMVVVHCGKGWPSKTFPSEVWQSYIDILLNNGFGVVLVGKTINEGQGFVEVDPTGCVDLRDKINLNEMIELIRMCDLLLSNDSSPVHMAGDSDCWIGLIATCKHPDYILPYRNGSNYYKAEALESDGMYFDYDRRPSTIDGSTIDQCTKERLLQCLPKPERILELAKKI